MTSVSVFHQVTFSKSEGFTWSQSCHPKDRKKERHSEITMVRSIEIFDNRFALLFGQDRALVDLGVLSWDLVLHQVVRLRVVAFDCVLEDR